jgi:signal transduction histidine kinase
MNPGWDAILPRLIHDARALLRGPAMRVQMLQRKPGADESSDREILRAVTEGHRRLDAFLNRCSDLKEALSPSWAPTMVSLEVAVLGARLAEQQEISQAGGCFSAGSLPECEVPASIERVLKELMSNSTRFRAQDRPLRIRLEAAIAGSALEIRYSDNSMGWDAEYTPRIFEAFECLDRSHGGFGVGLTIVKALIERCGGTIDADTDSERSVFAIRIPLG